MWRRIRRSIRDFFEPNRINELNKELYRLSSYYRYCWTTRDHFRIHKLIEEGANNFNQCLRSAAELGNSNAVKFFLEHGSVTDAGGHEAFYIACRDNNEELVSLLIKHSYCDLAQGFSIACSYANYDIMTLLNQEANTKKFQLDYNSALFRLCEGGPQACTHGHLAGYENFNDRLDLLTSFFVTKDLSINWSIGLQGAFHGFQRILDADPDSRMGAGYSWSSIYEHRHVLLTFYARIASDMISNGASINVIKELEPTFVRYLKAVYAREYRQVLSQVMPDEVASACLRY
jgi:hypothetical protein